MSNVEEEIDQPKQELSVDFKERQLIQKQCKHILAELMKDQSLAKFRNEYQKLFRALRASHDNQKRLFNKMNEFSKDMANQSAKLRVTLKLSQEDAQAISFLKQELQKTLKIQELSKQRENKAKQKIQELGSKITIIEGNLKQFQSSSTEKNNRLEQLKRKKDELMNEKNCFNDQLLNLKTELSSSYQEFFVSEQERCEIETKKNEVVKDIFQLNEKLKKDEGRKIKINEEFDNLKKQRDLTMNEGSKYEEEKNTLKKNIEAHQLKMESLQQYYNQVLTQCSVKENLISRHSSSNQDQKKIKLIEKGKIQETESEILYCQKQYNGLTSRTSFLENQNEKLLTKMFHTKQSLNAAQKENQILMNTLPQIHREILNRKKISEEDLKQIQKLENEKIQIQKQLGRLQTQHTASINEIQDKNEEIKHFQNKLNQGNQTIEQIKKQIQNVDKEKENYGKKAAVANAKYLQSLEEIKLKGNLISEYQKKNIDAEKRLKEQQSLYESVRADRNNFTKQLSENEDQIAETKRKYKIVNHQINQLKEEIEAKEVALAKEKFEHKKKDQTLLEHGRQVEQKKIALANKQVLIKNFHTQISKLHAIIKSSDSQRQKKKDEYELVVAERDILGTQLIRRNDQSALLYEKIKIQQTTLAKGQMAFRERLKDLKLLDCKKKDSKRQLRILQKENKQIFTNKDEIYHLQSQLIEEKLKVKALSEELENPLNIHRCRNLEGKDPDNYEMQEKIQTLQKQLIFKTQLLVQREVMVHQKSKQIQELRQIMKKQPGLQVAQSLSLKQRSINMKTKKMKELAAQINMYQAKTNEYKHEIERTQKEINELKRKYNEQKKREQISKENSKLISAL